MAAQGWLAAATAAYAAAATAQAIEAWINSDGRQNEDQLDIPHKEGLVALRTGLRDLNEMLNTSSETDGEPSLQQVLANISIGAAGAPTLNTNFTQEQATPALAVAATGLDNAAAIFNDIVSINALEGGSVTELTGYDVVGMLDRYLLAVELRPPGMWLTDSMWSPLYSTETQAQQTRASAMQEMESAPTEYGPNLFTAVAITRELFGQNGDSTLGLSLWPNVSSIDTGAWFEGLLGYLSNFFLTGPNPLAAVSPLQCAYHGHALAMTNAFYGTVDSTATSDPTLAANGLLDQVALAQFNVVIKNFPSTLMWFNTTNYNWGTIANKFG